jgi:ATP-dependent RNA helicase DeaD
MRRPLLETTSMTIDRLPAPLARALADKGYATLTSVQEAVLAEGVAGRDALVSAQTGSGKTVAFGLAVAPEILNGQDVLLLADKPVALAIAPTRELALQVARELEWLYAGAEAKLATCVGGMDYRTERRALERGAHIVVGTPGRLRDHIERGSLDLSGLRAVVLDEADEMLDLGFAEDLEFILAAAPPERRTLMFSATVPKEIERLAAEFQKDALRIVAQGEAKQHVDIEYRAFSVAVRDREHAIFNVLRFYEARTAIVFCKTRANVNHLLARMGNRGFQVVALSGELSQQERTHALQALRDGRARVCIATDVAARGIDLPGLELVVHADLPSNPETLLHRSGRTGRAGKKGVSALIVTPAEFKKAQRILASARVTAGWGPAPGADDVQARDDIRILEHPALTVPVGDEAGIAGDLLDRFGPDALAAAFVRLWREGRSAPEVLSTDAPVPAPSAPRDRGDFGPSVWFRINVGRTGRAEARWLLPKICDAGSIAKDAIGAIRVRDDETFVQIALPAAPGFGDRMDLDKGLAMERIEGEPDLDRPRPERAARPDRPPYAPKPPRAVADDAPQARDPGPKPRVKHDDRPRPDPSRDADRPASAPPAPPRAVRTEDRPRKPRWSPDQKAAPRSAGFKSHGGGSDRPGRAEGYRSHSAEGGATRREDGDRKPRAAKGEGYRPREDQDRPKKPYVPKGEGVRPKDDGDRPKRTYAPKGDEARPFVKRDGKAKAGGFKSHAAGGKAPFDKPRAEKPKPDPRDTSKRFVPPKGPKR